MLNNSTALSKHQFCFITGNTYFKNVLLNDQLLIAYDFYILYLTRLILVPVKISLVSMWVKGYTTHYLRNCIKKGGNNRFVANQTYR